MEILIKMMFFNAYKTLKIVKISNRRIFLLIMLKHPLSILFLKKFKKLPKIAKLVN